MNKKIQLLFGTLAALLLAFSPGLVQAEISTSSDQLIAYVLVLGMTQEPDPITSAIWHQLLPESDPLNPEGWVRLDGPPSIQLSLNGHNPVVVWAYNNGIESDIAFSSWDGIQWAEIEFLTSSTNNELDPRLYLSDNGDYHVAYWVEETEEIYVISRSAGSQFWDTPELITSAGRHPSIIFDKDVRLIAYERDGATGGQEIVVNRWDDGVTTEQVIATTAYTGTLNLILHGNMNRIWLDWIHEEDLLGYTQYFEGSWGVSPRHVPWLDHSWIGAEDARRAVQFEIMRDE
jgi:hypothetical protein